MQTPKIAKVVILILAGAALFWAGRWSYSRNIVTYSFKGNQVAVHLDWPTSGLPLAEYISVLTQLRSGATNEAIGNLEMLLDSTVADARSRRPRLPSAGTEQLDKALAYAARYRGKFPRPLSEGSGFYWTSDKQLEVDRYLEEFKSPNNAKQAEPSARMPEALAQKKYSCPACGAAAEWNPAKQFWDNPNGIGIIQPSVAAQRLRWVIIQTIHQL